MEEVAKLIIKLFKVYHRVSLPTIGVFSIEQRPAELDAHHKVITPPTQVVVFSKDTHNDGLVEQLYADSKNISLDKARAELRQHIADIRFELDANSKVYLPGIGTLKQNPAREIEFFPSKHNIEVEDSFLFEPVIELEESKVSAQSKNWKQFVPKITTSSIAIFVIVAIITAIIVFLLLRRDKNSSQLLPPEMPPIDQSAAIENIEEEEDEEDEISLFNDEWGMEEEPTPPNEIIVHKPAATKPIPKPTPKPKEEKPIVREINKAPTTPKAQVPKTSVCEYCVIVASFNTLEGARLKSERYKKQGYEKALVIPGKERYRVAMGCYTTKEAANAEARKFSETIQGVWVLESCR
ncbi:MAG: SPOR domain-containing protein [Bacteroidales bacterium]